MPAKLRFGIVNELVLDGPAWLDHVRRIEDARVDVLLLRDHYSAAAFGPQLAPFSALASAAAVTTRLRVGTLVLSNDFRHPVIVAHEAASLHHLSGGRFELGIGAGWYQPEYSAAGLAFDSPGRRIDRLEESLTIIRGLPAGPACCGSRPVTRTSWDCCRPRSGAPKIATTRSTGCHRRWITSSPSCARRPVTGSGSWSSARSACSASPRGGARAPRNSSRGAAGAGSLPRTCGRCRPSSSAAWPRSARISRPGASGSACPTWSPRTTSCPRSPRSSPAPDRPGPARWLTAAEGPW